jgi:hypothetical protein
MKRHQKETFIGRKKPEMLSGRQDDSYEEAGKLAELFLRRDQDPQVDGRHKCGSSY